MSDPSDIPPNLAGRLKARARELLQGSALGGGLRRLEDRAMAVILQLTRITNDGAYQSMQDAERTTRAEPPPPPGKRRGLPGG